MNAFTRKTVRGSAGSATDSFEALLLAQSVRSTSTAKHQHQQQHRLSLTRGSRSDSAARDPGAGQSLAEGFLALQSSVNHVAAVRK